jgi:outer membrane protein assembly factor BamE (lipoprotein component of BamABCDE complex)
MRRIAWPLLLAGCSTPVVTTLTGDKPPDRTPEVDRKYKEAAARGEVKFGMTRAEVRTAWGEPARTRKTTYRKKLATLWAYPRADIYIDEDGFVIGWEGATR